MRAEHRAGPIGLHRLTRFPSGHGFEDVVGAAPQLETEESRKTFELRRAAAEPGAHAIEHLARCSHTRNGDEHRDEEDSRSATGIRQCLLTERRCTAMPLPWRATR